MKLLFLALLFCVGIAEAAPIAIAENGGVRITLTDEPCALSAVENLPYRAIWEEVGKTFQGCFGVSPFGGVLAFWSDRTVVFVPLSEFQPARRI